MFYRCNALAVVCLLACISAFGQEALGADKRETIRGLVEQLSAPLQRDRQAAQDALLEIGPDVEDYLKAERMNPQLGFEQQRRIDWLLERVKTPELALIWRGQPRTKIPEGLEYGSLIISVDDLSITDEEQQNLALRRLGKGRVTLKVWKYGEDPKVIRTEVTKEQQPGFNAYPDDISEYDKHGHKGEWSFVARRGLQISYNYFDEKSLEDFERAWELGCRDPLILTRWAWVLRRNHRVEDSLKLLKEKSPEVISVYPGGKWTYGNLPVAHARALDRLGRHEEGLTLLDEALAEAHKAKAHLARPLLLRRKLRAICQYDPEKFFDYLRDNPALDLTKRPGRVLMHYAMSVAAAKGDPAEGLAFINHLAETKDDDNEIDKLDAIRRAWEMQIELAKNWHTDKPHRVLIRRDPSFFQMERGPERASARFRLPPMPKWGSVRMGILPLWRRPWSSKTGARGVFGLMKRQKPHGSYNAWDSYVSFYDHEAVRMRLAGRSLTPYIGRCNPNWLVGNIADYIQLDIQPGRRQLFINNKRRRMWYGNLEPDTQHGPLRPALEVHNARGLWHDIQYFAWSATQVDNDAIREIFGDLPDACRAGDTEKVRELYEQLFTHWKDIPEAAEAIEEHRALLEYYQQIFTDEGLDLCDKDLLNHPQTYRVDTDRVIVTDGWLSIQDRWCACGLSYPITVPEHCEITGLLHAGGTSKKNRYLILQPNAFRAFSRDVRSFVPALQWRPARKTVGLDDFRDTGDETHVQRDEFGDQETLSFCMRITPEGTSLFVNDGEEPLLTWKKRDDQPDGNRLIFLTKCSHDGPAQLGQARVRAIDPQTPLDAPTDLPDITQPPWLKPLELLEQTELAPSKSAAFPPVLTLEEVNELIAKRKAAKKED